MNTNFKYSLSKKGKTICPNCNKKTFVQYVETETGNIMPEKFGRCDREQSCGYFSYPSDNKPLFIQKYELNEIKTDYIAIEKLDKIYTESKNCHLANFLLLKYEYKIVSNVFKDYLVSELNGKTVFWQIDQLERIRSAKIMDYNPSNGKRVKDNEGKSSISWIHKQPFNLKQCLFGLHLTKQNQKKSIAIVESEKTALIMAICEPNFIWLACGSKNGFKIEYLSVLKFRNIIAFPDKGCFNDWNIVSENLNKLGFDIRVTDFLEKIDCEIGSDIADEYLRL